MIKKVLKIVGIVFLLLVVIVGVLWARAVRMSAVPDAYWDKIETSASMEKKYNALGSYTIESKTYEAKQDDRDRQDNYYKVWSPTQEGRYPLVVMVNGTGVPCDKYEAVFEHIASYGYVVIGNNYGTNWDGLHASETLQFALDTKEIANQIDENKIAIGGHSQGGMGAFNAITEYENGSLYKVAFSLSPTNEQVAIGLEWGFDLDTENAYAFSLNEIEIPMLLVAGTGSFDADTVSPLDQMQEEYEALQGDVVMARRSDDVDHGDILYEANGYVIAWLDYYLKDKTENEAIFYGQNSELSMNTRYQDYQAKKRNENNEE